VVAFDRSMNNTYLRGIYLRLAGVVTLVVMLALAANAYLSQRTFEHALAPQVAAKVASVGASIRSLVARAVDSGVPFAELYGVTERFTEIKEEAPEITYFALTNAAGAVQHEKGQAPEGAAAHFRSPEILALMTAPLEAAPFKRVGKLYLVSMPISTADGPLGVLHMGLDVNFFDSLVTDMLFDVLVVLVVSLFFTLELLHFMAGAKLEAALRDMGAAFERGAAGDFRVSPRQTDHKAGDKTSDRTSEQPSPPDESAFAGVLAQLEANLQRVNRAFVGLVQEVDSYRKGPAHERPPGLAAAQMGVRALVQRCKFGEDSSKTANSDNQLAKVRAPLFMFILAEELTRSFLPGYVNELLVPIAGLSPQLVVGLPIALFMLIVAIGQPFLGVYTERVGHRRAMLVGAGIAAVGFIASAMAASVLDLMLWRSLCAVGYAMVFVASQAYVLEHATAGNRARSFALFVGAIMAASVCGPSIGGILADNLGFRPTLALAAVLAASSMLIINQLPKHRGDNKGLPVRLPRLVEIGQLLRNRRFMVVTGLAAMPAKILLTGMCFYLVPLYVVAQGSTQAMAGRILMTYGVVMVVLGPVTARLATNRQRMHLLVGGGLLVSGLGGALMLLGPEVGWVFVAVALVGLGQSMSISAQSALVAEHCGPEIEKLGEGVVYGVYRLLERLGNAAGPLIAATLALQLGQRTGFVLIGCGVALCGAAFLLATLPRRVRSTNSAEADAGASQSSLPSSQTPTPDPAQDRAYDRAPNRAPECTLSPAQNLAHPPVIAGAAQVVAPAPAPLSKPATLPQFSRSSSSTPQGVTP
jgi:MFS family permease